MLITKTPLRISLLGGGTDVAAFYKKYPGAVVSFAIDKYIYVSVNPKFDGSFRVSYSHTENVNTIDEIRHDIVRETLRLFNIKRGLEITSVSDIPGSGTGLGSSSAFTVGLVKALGRKNFASVVAERAYTIEFSKCNHPVGKQDQYASSYGGINYIKFNKNYVGIEPIFPKGTWISEFQSHCLLLWTNRNRDANEILSSQQKLFETGTNLELGIQLSRLTEDFYNELTGGADMKRIGEFLNEGWKIKKFFAKDVTNPTIDKWYASALSAGAYGGKLLGAGGGGFLFFLAPPYLHGKIEEATGLRRVNFKIEMKGSEVIYDG